MAKSDFIADPGSKERQKARSPRRRARELCLQSLYQWLLNHEDCTTIEAHTRQIQGFQRADVSYFETLFHGAVKHADQLRALIKPCLDRNLETISPVEHSILLLACFELTQQTEVPYKVVINEAVELAKSFGGSDGFKYINGVLDKLAAQVRQLDTLRT